MNIINLRKGDKIVYSIEKVSSTDSLKNSQISKISSIENDCILMDNNTNKISFEKLCETYKFINSDEQLEEIFMGLDKIEFIARARHLAWTCYQMGAGQDYNTEITKDQLDSLMHGVLFGLANPKATPEENHINWMNSKLAQGWVYGETKDMEKKTHFDLVPFDALIKVEKDKDIMDCSMNREFNDLWNKIFK